MGRKLNLSHLSEEECEQILQVIQKDFELRQKEKERLGKIEEEVTYEEDKTQILSKHQKFNENCCIRCCQTFGIIFNRKQTCLVCKHYVCKSCSKYDSEAKGYICQLCLKEYELKLQSCEWFYQNVGGRFRRFGSAKVVRTLYKRSGDCKSRRAHSDNESDSGYDPSLFNSLQSGSIQSVKKSRPPLQGIFPEIVITSDDGVTNYAEDYELDSFAPSSPVSEASVSPTQSQPSYSRVSQRQSKNEAHVKSNSTRDIYKEAFETTKQAEEIKFHGKFDQILLDLQRSLDNQSPHQISYGSTSYGAVMVNYRSQIRELLIGLSQRLQLAIESFDSSSPSDEATSQKVRQFVSKLVEDRLGESIDLTSDEAVSDLSSLSDESTEHRKSFEDQLAQAVVAKVLENRRKDNGDRLRQDETLETGEGTTSSENEAESVDKEFRKLRNFAFDLSPRPPPQSQEVVEFVEEVPIEKVSVNREESQSDFASRCSSYDRVHESHIPLPDFGDLGSNPNEIDPDLLSMNLAPILEEDEEGTEGQDEASAAPYDWRANWIFKGSAAISPYDNLAKKKIGEEMGQVYMMVPNPESEYGPQIGSRDADELSDMSENADRSDDEDSLEGMSDEENSFYAKTSEEIARITRKSSRTQASGSSLANTSVQTEDSELDTSFASKHTVNSSSDSEQKGQSSQDDSSSKGESKTSQKLVEELVPAEGDDPKFEIAPDSLTVPEGDPAKFTCRVGGTTPVDVFWYRVLDEVDELVDSEKYDISKDGNRYSVTVFNPVMADGGQYMCIAINEKGRCCQYFILTVKKNKQDLKAPEFLKGISDLEVKEGQSIKFRCKVKGYPQPRVVWYKDMKKLRSDTNIRIEKFGNRDYVLTIYCASLHDDAEYTVSAKNIAGEVKSSAQLIVDEDEDLTVENYLPEPDREPLSTTKVTTSIFDRRRTESPTQTADDHKLTSLSQKLSNTHDSVSDVAEDMLTSANEKQAAGNVRKTTSSVLSVITATEDLIQSEKDKLDCLATSTPRIYEDQTNNNDMGTDIANRNHIQSSYNLTGQNSPFTDNVLPAQTADQNVRTTTEVTFMPSFQTGARESVSSELGIDIPSNEETSLDMSDFSLEGQDISDTNEPLLVNLGSKRFDTQRYNRDFVVNSSPKVQRKQWEVRTDSYSPSAQIINQERQVADAEEKIYMVAGNVFSLEDKVKDLTSRVQAVDDRASGDRLSQLEDEVVHSVARAHQREKDVSSIERSVGQLQFPTSPTGRSRQSSGADNSGNLSPSLSIDSGVSSMIERPPPTVLVGQTSEEDLPESRTEFNEEYGDVELPSVNRLKAMFGSKAAKSLDDGSNFRRQSPEYAIHSITARSLPKDQLEKIRRSANEGAASPVRVSSKSMTLIPQNDLTASQHELANLSLSPQEIKQMKLENPQQIFPEEEGQMFPKHNMPSKPPRQSTQAKGSSSVSTPQSEPIKTSVKFRPSTPQSPALSTPQSEPIKTSVTFRPSTPQSPALSTPQPEPIKTNVTFRPSTPQSEPVRKTVTSRAQTVTLGQSPVHAPGSEPAKRVAPRTSSEMDNNATPKAPPRKKNFSQTSGGAEGGSETKVKRRIKTGSLLARTSFWEKRISTGASDSDVVDEYPEMVTDEAES